jgi:hypothetical protein
MQTLYVCDDRFEVILGGNIYQQQGFYYWQFGCYFSLTLFFNKALPFYYYFYLWLGSIKYDYPFLSE